ncbi:MAG: hypothetical protein KF774_01675 [Planctomyces sp.]|nr:hypothetical protein [Planctomyces sp.]
MRSASWKFSVALLGAFGAVEAPARSADVGAITGQIVLDGEPPKLKKKVTSAAVAACSDVPNEDLVVDDETMGIANVVVFLRKAPDGMPSELKASEEDAVTFDQKDCVFLPHVLVVRTDQAVHCISNDAVAHNVHTHPFKNTGVNFAIAANTLTPVQVPMKQTESLPVKVSCDMHSWMTAWWVVTDHPYVAVTDKEGKFKIENLPVGEHVFTVWQEKAGYLDRNYRVNVAAGETELAPLKAPLAKFKLEQ